MKITKVTYQKAFVIGPYLQHKIGIEVETDESDDTQRAFEYAKEIVDKWNEQSNPGSAMLPIPEWAYKFQGPIPETQVDNGNSPEERRMIMLAIDNETRLRDENGDGGLLQWQYAVKKYPDLVDSFNVKVSELLIRQKIKS